MRFIAWGLAITLALAIIPAGVWAGTSTSPQKAPEGWVLVEEDVVLVFSDEPGEHFQKGRESFLKKDLKAAAHEIREAAAFLKLEAGRATAEGKKALLASIRELEKLAEGVERGTVTAVKDLDALFARAHQALAKHHHLKAAASWAKKAAKKTGQDLKAAAIHLEHGLAWTGHKGEAGGIAVINGTRLLAGKLIEGVGWVPAEVGKGITAVGEEVEKLGKKIEPAKRP